VSSPEPVSTERIGHSIHLVRGLRIMLDEDLASLYAVEVKSLNQAVKRNRDRFPPDFMFQLRTEEVRALRSQTVTLKPARGQHRKYAPYAFTEQGVAMLSSVLRSPRAVQVNVEIMRAFVRLRQLSYENGNLARRLDALEKRYDARFREVFEAIRALMAPPVKQRRRIGFRSPDREAPKRRRGLPAPASKHSRSALAQSAQVPDPLRHSALDSRRGAASG
jgi:hypothetical protein